MKDNEYAKAKKCMWWQWTCIILYAILSVIYCIGLIFMEVSVGKVGGAIPSEKNMLNDKIGTLLDLGEDYSAVLDKSLSNINITN